MRSQIFTYFALALIINIQLYYCKVFVRTIAFAVVVYWLILLAYGYSLGCIVSLEYI